MAHAVSTLERERQLAGSVDRAIDKMKDILHSEHLGLCGVAVVLADPKTNNVFQFGWIPDENPEEVPTRSPTALKRGVIDAFRKLADQLEATIVPVRKAEPSTEGPKS